jgi:hypothetical protein
VGPRSSQPHQLGSFVQLPAAYPQSRPQEEALVSCSPCSARLSPKLFRRLGQPYHLPSGLAEASCGEQEKSTVSASHCLVLRRDILATSAPSVATSSQRRRRSSASKSPAKLEFASPILDEQGYSSRSTSNVFGDSLPAIPGTPNDPNMSLSRSPSPQRGGGWSSPGLTTPYNGTSGRSTPVKQYANGGPANVTWAAAQARSADVRGYPSFQPRNQGFFSRHLRRLSATLPHINYSDKEKLGRGRWKLNTNTKLGRFLGWAGMIAWRMRLRLLIVGTFLLAILLFYVTRKYFFFPTNLPFSL